MLAKGCAWICPGAIFDVESVFAYGAAALMHACCFPSRAFLFNLNQNLICRRPAARVREIRTGLRAGPAIDARRRVPGWRRSLATAFFAFFSFYSKLLLGALWGALWLSRPDARRPIYS